MSSGSERDGSTAEALAGAYLARHGLTILARNCPRRGGEIDLVAREGGTLVSVEVRLRRSARFGAAGASKQPRVLHAARHYLAGQGEFPCRCDGVALDALDPARIEWIRDAFRE